MTSLLDLGIQGRWQAHTVDEGEEEGWAAGGEEEGWAAGGEEECTWTHLLPTVGRLLGSCDGLPLPGQVASARI